MKNQPESVREGRNPREQDWKSSITLQKHSSHHLYELSNMYLRWGIQTSHSKLSNYAASTFISSSIIIKHWSIILRKAQVSQQKKLKRKSKRTKKSSSDNPDSIEEMINLPSPFRTILQNISLNRNFPNAKMSRNCIIPQEHTEKDRKQEKKGERPLCSELQIRSNRMILPPFLPFSSFLPFINKE